MTVEQVTHMDVGERLWQILVDRQFRFRFRDEAELHGHLAEVFRQEGIPFEREVPVTGGRIDFVLEGGCGVEVKVGGSLSALTRQVGRYVQDDRIQSVLVITTLLRLVKLPATLNGKRIYTVWLANL